MRFPKHFPAGHRPAEEFVAAYMPNVHSLWTQGVPFGGHHTAAQACTPARNTMVTGMHARRTLHAEHPHHRQDLTIQTGFPTYGKLLRQSGYRTPWIGKWHLSGVGNTTALEQYGFDAFTSPDPVGRPDGQVVDPRIADQAIGFLSSQTAAERPVLRHRQLHQPARQAVLLGPAGRAAAGVQGRGHLPLQPAGRPGRRRAQQLQGRRLPLPTATRWCRTTGSPRPTLHANKPYTQFVTRETFDTLLRHLHHGQPAGDGLHHQRLRPSSPTTRSLRRTPGGLAAWTCTPRPWWTWMWRSAVSSPPSHRRSATTP